MSENFLLNLLLKHKWFSQVTCEHTVADQIMKCGDLTPPTLEPCGVSLHFSLSPAVALCVCNQEMLMCVMRSLRVCIPGENTGAEARERNESCAVNHSLPHRRRGETHAESNN